MHNVQGKGTGDRPPIHFYIVGLSMMRYRSIEREKHIIRRAPVQGTHGEGIVVSVPNSELILEVKERIELM